MSETPHVPTPESKHLSTTYSLESWATWCEDTADTLAGLAVQLRKHHADPLYGVKEAPSTWTPDWDADNGSSPCSTSLVSSRVCERGTKGCVITHFSGST